LSAVTIIAFSEEAQI